MNDRRAIVAEDSAHVLFSLELLLEQADVEIVGSSATVGGMCKLIETTPADVAILDVNLNGELIFPAAEMAIEKGIPVIFTTGYAPTKNFPERFLSVPTLQKPYYPDELLHLLEVALAKKEAA
jgi:DNA-binding NtrC family response regulator